MTGDTATVLLNGEEVVYPRPYIEPLPPSNFMHWTYDALDPAIMLFTAAVTKFNLTFPMGARVLELGCAESDWLERMHRCDPSLELTGVDARHQDRAANGFTLIQGNAMDPFLFEPESFDRIVLLGALEHFGLGFYGDPKNVAGDFDTMRNVEEWLAPGGFVYFDVPCQPTFRVSENGCYRSYGPIDIQERLIAPGLQKVNRAYSLPEPWAGTWCQEPTVERVPYWFCAVLAQKVS